MELVDTHCHLTFEPLAEDVADVLDAIRVMTLSPCADLIWKDLKNQHPELLEHCGDHPFQQEGSLPVMDSDWLRPPGFVDLDAA